MAVSTYADELKTYEREAEHLAALCAGEIGDEEEIKAAWITYFKLFRECLERGRGWTPERVRYIYPALREIKAEIDEIERECRKHALGKQVRRKRARGAHAKAV
jgi:hypothetical protein